MGGAGTVNHASQPTHELQRQKLYVAVDFLMFLFSESFFLVLVCQSKRYSHALNRERTVKRWEGGEGRK